MLASDTPRALGYVRYCEGTTAGAGGELPDWAHETLLEHDAERRFRYEMNDNIMGFGLFFAMFRVIPAAAGAWCELRWGYECEPMSGTPRYTLVARLQAELEYVAVA